MGFKLQERTRELKLRITNRLKNAVFAKWIVFNALSMVWFIAVFPILYFLVTADSPLNPFERGALYVFILAITGLFVLLDNAKFYVAVRNPRNFLKIEQVKTYFSKIFWLLIYFPSIILVFMYYFLPMILANEYLNKIAPVFIPLFIIYLLVFFGSTFYQLGMIGNVHQQPRVLRARSEASFRVLSELLSNPSTKKRRKFVGYFLRIFGRRAESIEEKKKLNRLFENGMKDLNGLLWYLYGFEICNYSKYCDYFRLVIWTENSSEIARILKKLELLACELRHKIDVSCVLWAIRQFLKEEQFVSKEDLLQELDFKTGINKWYSRHKEGVTLSLLIVPIIISVLALFLSIQI